MMNSWLAALLPPPDEIGCRVEWLDPATRTARAETVTQAALQLQHDPADAAVLDHQVVAAPDDGHRQLLALGEHQRVADVVDVLRDDEDVGEAADAE